MSLNGSILEKAVFWKRQNYRNVKLTNSCQEPGVRKGFDDKGAASPPLAPRGDGIDLSPNCGSDFTNLQVS